MTFHKLQEGSEMPELLRAPAREVRTVVLDSHRWDKFEPRDGDIIIGTYVKCGTTWMQRIIDLLVFQSPDIRPFGDISPWLDSTIFSPIAENLATLTAQGHRRFIKSHLPFDALPLWDTVKYVHVGRDGRDAWLSWHNHVRGASPEHARRILEQSKELVAAGKRPSPRLSPPPADPRQFFLHWLDMLEAAPPDGPNLDELTFFGFETTYWRERKRPNLLLVHYGDLQNDLAAEMWRLSDFLEIETPESLMPRLVEAASFAFMKTHGDQLFPRLKEVFDRGADRFINRGRSGVWREYMGPAEVARYEAISRKRASPGLLTWLERGRIAGVDPRFAPD